MAPLQPAPAWDSVREWSPGLPCSRPRGGPPPAGHTTAQGSRPTYCAREDTRWLAARDQVQLRAQTLRARAVRPVRAAGPRCPRAPISSGSTAEGGTRSAPFPQSAPAGAGVRLQEKLVSGFAFRTKPPGPARCPARPLAGSGPLEDSGQAPELSRTPGRAAAHGGGRARGAQTVRTGSLRFQGPRGTYRAAARCGARALSAARAAPLRTPAGPPTPPRFPPARPALAPSARLRWNQ